MIQIKNNVIGVWSHGEYTIEVCKEDEDRPGLASIDAYLQKEGYGIKSHMFGVSAEESLDFFLELVEANLPDYIEWYEEEYC